MKTSLVSTLALHDTNRASVGRLQSQLVDAQREVATGRYADLGLALGHNAGQAVSLRDDHSRLNTILATNSGVTTRLEATQNALGGLLDVAQTFVSSLVGTSGTSVGPGVLAEQARNQMAAMSDLLNVKVDGASLFSGINTDTTTMESYFGDPAPASRTAVATAFTAAFGVTQDDPLVENIAAGDMETFLSGDFAALFSDANWSTSWSGASDQVIRSRISTHELIETSVSGNEEAFRKLASGLAMVADLGGEQLNGNTFQVVATRAVALVGEAIQDIAKLQGRVGVVEESVGNANQRHRIQIDLITRDINALEGVDPYEASTRVTSLVTQIETSYALTARLQRISLMNYL